MNKTIISLFLNKPASYILLGEAGFGKSTQLKIFYNKMLGKTIQIDGYDRMVIPIYIPMGDINKNRASIDSFFLHNYIRKKYFPQAGIGQINDLFEDNGFYYIFLLDAVNEVINVKNENEEYIYDLLINSIYAFHRYSNVKFIISSTGNLSTAEILGCKVMNDGFFEGFDVCTLKKLEKKDIIDFLETDIIKIPDYPFLSNPMFLKNFKKLYRIKSIDALNSKSKLIEETLKEQILDKRQMDLFKDINNEDLKQVFEMIMPFIGYNIALSMMSNEYYVGESADYLLERYFLLKGGNNNDNDKEVFVKKYKKIIGNQQIFDIERMVFYHHYYLEFFASYSFYTHNIFFRETNFFDREYFMERLIEQLNYNGKADLVRRSRFLGLAEFIVCETGEELEKYINNGLSQKFFQELAGVYEDLKGDYTKDAAKYAWASYRYVMDSNEISYKMLLIKNMLFYCMLKDIGYSYNYKGKTYNVYDVSNSMRGLIDTLSPDAVNTVEHSDTIYDCNKKDNFYKCYAKALNNMGAFYYQLKDYKEALKWHKKALEYRKGKKHGIIDSCRCIMGDYYHLYGEENNKNYIEAALSYYREGNDEIKKYNNLENNTGFDYIKKIPVDYATRGLGIIAKLVEDEGRMDLVKELIFLGEHIFEVSTASRRIDRYNIENVMSLTEFVTEKEFDGKEELEDLRKRIGEYLY